jgi:hypothetical protein
MCKSAGLLWPLHDFKARMPAWHASCLDHGLVCLFEAGCADYFRPRPAFSDQVLTDV